MNEIFERTEANRDENRNTGESVDAHGNFYILISMFFTNFKMDFFFFFFFSRSGLDSKAKESDIETIVPRAPIRGTKVCMYWSKPGKTCNRGDHCRFRHDNAQVCVSINFPEIGC